MQKALAMWLLLAASGGAQPEVSPTQVVQAATEQVLQVVQDGQLAAPVGQDQRRVEVQRIADRLFDFQEMSRRALRSKIVTGRGSEIPVDYRLHQVGARWVVYDVAVSGVSFVANYRGQFDRIIRSSSYQALIRDLKSKYAGATSRAAGPVATPASAPAPKNP